MRKEEPQNDDWKTWKKGWQYDGDIEDPKYLKDRDELFYRNEDERAPYHGWWWYQGDYSWKQNRLKRQEKAKKNDTKK